MQIFLVQEIVTGGVELILGLHREPLGTAVLPGMGGVTAELVKDTSMRMPDSECGLSHEEALELIQELKTFPLLNGYRGRPRADIDALASAIVAFAWMATELGSRRIEAEFNVLVQEGV
ncbi:acetate--CoA ligase family protein [Paraburkholderia unamae]|uniref:acetate--CoA ligase family protein n=1 Tax=Paraburkholderia unamae TaxID=219649 RepID=UPI003CCC4901